MEPHGPHTGHHEPHMALNFEILLATWLKLTYESNLKEYSIISSDIRMRLEFAFKCMQFLNVSPPR